MNRFPNRILLAAACVFVALPWASPLHAALIEQVALPESGTDAAAGISAVETYTHAFNLDSGAGDVISPTSLDAGNGPQLSAPANPQFAPPVSGFIKDSIVDHKALLGGNGASYGRAMNGQAFQNDILVSHNGWQYTAWYDTVGADQSVLIARRSILGSVSGPWEIHDTGSNLDNGDETESGDRLWNAHNVIALGICELDGTLHISWDHHSNTLRYRKSMPGLTTDASASWGAGMLEPERDWLVAPGSTVTRVTYPMFISTPDGGLLFNFRIGTSQGGSNHIASYHPFGGNYAAPVLVTDKDGSYTGRSNASTGNFTSTSRNAYANGFDYGPDGTLHHTWTWRESVVASNHDICYAYSTDGGTSWRNNAGTVIANTSLGQRIQVDSPGIVAVPLDCRQQVINQQAQCVDDQGRVHILLYHRRQEPGYEWTLGDSSFGGPDTAYHHYFRDPSTGVWTRTRLPLNHPPGSRPDIETKPNGDVFATFNSGGKIIVVAATAAANYQNWTILHAYGSNFFGEPRLDHTRLRKSGVLSVFLAENAPSVPDPTPVPLHVVDFSTGTVFEAFAGQDLAVTDLNGDGQATVHLNGSVGDDSGMPLLSQRWLSGTTALSETSALQTALSVGTHKLWFEATSASGIVSTDEITVTVHPVGTLSATASTHDGNFPSNTLDSNLGSRWSGSGLGATITWDLGGLYQVDAARFAFHLGNTRVSYFDLHVSTDGLAWTPVLTGAASSGATTGLEKFTIPPTTARFIRYVGGGNSSSIWNSLTEVAFDRARDADSDGIAETFEIIRPYQPDAHTLHLWHFDSLDTPVPNAADPLHPLLGLHNSATLWKPGPGGFGTALDTNTGISPNNGILTYAATLSSAATPDAPRSFAWHGANGAFTLEAVVKLASLPSTWATPGQIICMEGDGNGTNDRVFQIRMRSNGGKPLIEFFPLASGVSGSVQGTLPTSGIHAPNTAAWFHVALTYDGNPGASGNLKLYWTRLVHEVSAANEIGSGILNTSFSNQQGDFSIGNEARDTGGSSEFFPGLIDEVRISSIARQPNDFFFKPADSDEDGLADAWEKAHFGSLGEGPGSDFDHDGTSNLTEFLLGLPPADGTSSFRAAIQPAIASVTLTWSSAPGLSFRIERSTTLSGIWTGLGTVQGSTFTDPNPPPGSAYYRVLLLTP